MQTQSGIQYYGSDKNADKGRGRGSKIPKILYTSFKYGPLCIAGKERKHKQMHW